MPDFDHYLDRLKWVLTDARKVSPYLTKDLKFSQGVANRILNKQRDADERLLRPLLYLENVSPTWMVEGGRYDPFLVERPATAMDAEGLVRMVLRDEPAQWRLTVVMGAMLAAVVLDIDVTKRSIDEDWRYREIMIIAGGMDPSRAQMMVAAGLPDAAQVKLATLDDALIKQIRSAQMGTFKLFGSTTFGIEGLLSNAPDFPIHLLQLAAQPVASYSSLPTKPGRTKKG